MIETLEKKSNIEKIYVGFIQLKRKLKGSIISLAFTSSSLSSIYSLLTNKNNDEKSTKMGVEIVDVKIEGNMQAEGILTGNQSIISKCSVRMEEKIIEEFQNYNLALKPKLFEIYDSNNAQWFGNAKITIKVPALDRGMQDICLLCYRENLRDWEVVKPVKVDYKRQRIVVKMNVSSECVIGIIYQPLGNKIEDMFNDMDNTSLWEAIRIAGVSIMKEISAYREKERGK